MSHCYVPDACKGVADPAQHPRCVLCPQDTSALSIKAKKRPPADFDVLSCLKPTESRQWAHILCASWHPEVQFTNTSTYKDIENISLLPVEKWQEVRRRVGADAIC